MKKRIADTFSNRCLCLLAGSCLMALSGRAQVVFSENFDGQAAGANPTGFSSVSPGTAISGTSPGSVGVTVVDLGAGNHAVNLFDYSTTANARLEEDYATMSGAHLSLTFKRNANIAPTATTAGLYVAMGASGLSQGTSANRALDVRLYNDGTYRLEAGTQNPDGSFISSGTTGSANFEAAGTTYNTHTLDIYAYAGTTGDSGLNYTGPDSVGRVLDAHSYAVYFDNTLVSASATPNNNNGFYTSSFYSSSVLGRFGIITGGGSANTNLDFLVDSLSVSALKVAAPITLSNYQALVNRQVPNYYFTFDGGSLSNQGTNAVVSPWLAQTINGIVYPPDSYPQIAPDVFGNPTNAIYFSAVSDTLVDQNEPADLIINSGAGGVASTNSTASGSFSFLFRTLDPGAVTGQKYILCGGYTAANHNMMSLYFESTNAANGDPQSLKLRFGDHNVTILQASNVLSDTWYYFAFTYTEATNGYFFDATGTNLVTVKGKWYLGIPGNPLASDVTTNAIDAVAGQGNILYIGNRDTTTTGFRSPGTGVVDEFATWKRRLSDSEVDAQFAALPKISVVPPSTLAAYQKVVITNQAATYFFPFNGNYVDAVGGSVTLQTNTLSSGSYSFAPDWFGDVPGSAVFSASAAALSSSGNLISGGGTYAGSSGSGKGSISCLFFAPASTNFTGYAAIYQAPGATTTTNAFYLRFNKSQAGSSSSSSLTLYFGDSSAVILPMVNITPGSWYYFAMNYDESLTANQVNWWLGLPGGTLNSGSFSAAAGSLAGTGTTLTIGNSPTYGSPFRQSASAPGNIADFAIWNGHVLTGSEVTAQFDALVVSSAPAAAPVLSIVLSGANVILSWPADTDSGYSLQSTPRLSPPSWNGAGAPVIVGGQYVVTNAVNSLPQFYRLQK